MNWRTGAARLPCAGLGRSRPARAHADKLRGKCRWRIAHDGLGRSRRRRPHGRRRFDIISTLAAALMITASTAASVLEQARVDNEPALAQRNGTGDGSRVAPGRETVIGAYTGAPYDYPSAARITNPNAQGATDFTIDPVNWYTDPFKSPIYYGARVQRWFAGGKTGGMVDFIHSKAIAPLEEETELLRHPRRPAAAAARAHRRRREQARVLARPQHAAVQRPVAPARHRSARQPVRRRRRRRVAAAYRDPADQRQPPAHLRIQLCRPCRAGAARGRDPSRPRVVLRRVQVHLRRLRGAAVADERQLAAARHVAAGEALVCRRAAARRPHRDASSPPIRW